MRFFSLISVCMAAVLLCLPRVCETSEVLWPRATEFPPVALPSPTCDVCQELVRLVIEDTKAILVKAKKMLGATDIALMEVLNADRICTYGKWKDPADELGTAPVYNMTALCKKLIDDNEDDFEKFIPKFLNDEEEARQNICVPNPCEAVWIEELKPGVRERSSVKNAREAKEFFEWNSQQEGVVVTPSGLQYKKFSKEMVKRLGAQNSTLDEAPQFPTLTSEVLVKFTGTKLNGEEFDKSRSNSSVGTSHFKLNEVVPGLREGLALMEVGDHFTFYLPSELAYGNTGAGNSINPGEALVFDIYMLNIKETEPASNPSESSALEDDEEL